MTLGFLILAYVFGVVSGLVFGRIFCDWHHKNDTQNGWGPQGDSAGTIGEQIEKSGRCGCSPGCCGDDKK